MAFQCQAVIAHIAHIVQHNSCKARSMPQFVQGMPQCTLGMPQFVLGMLLVRPPPLPVIMLEICLPLPLMMLAYC